MTTTQLEATIDVLKDVSGDALTTLQRGIGVIGDTLTDTFGHPAPTPPPSHKGRWLLLVVVVLAAVGAVVFLRSRQTEPASPGTAAQRDDRAA